MLNGGSLVSVLIVYLLFLLFDMEEGMTRLRKLDIENSLFKSCVETQDPKLDFQLF